MFGSKEFIKFAQHAIADYFNKRRDVTGAPEIKPKDVYTVWYSKSLQNHKGCFSTPVADGMYYEVTYNGDDEVAYLDAYKKWENISISNPAEYLEKKAERS